jgi:hypothetical protein
MLFAPSALPMGLQSQFNAPAGTPHSQRRLFRQLDTNRPPGAITPTEHHGRPRMAKPEPAPARDVVLPDQFLTGDMTAGTLIEALASLRFPIVRRHRTARTVSIDSDTREYLVEAIRARARRP